MKERLLAILLFAVCFSACSPKYTASFEPSRKFYNDNKPVAVKASKIEDETKPALETLEPKEEVALASVASENVLIEKKTDTRTQKIIDKYAIEGVPSAKTVLKMPQKQRLKVLKEVKKDIKSLKKAKKKQSIGNRKVYAGIIIALAGLVIAILASGTIGALGIIVGVVLIAWGLIEQGGL